MITVLDSIRSLSLYSPIERTDIQLMIFKVGTDKSGPCPLDHSNSVEVIIHNTVGARRTPKAEQAVIITLHVYKHMVNEQLSW